MEQTGVTAGWSIPAAPRFGCRSAINESQGCRTILGLDGLLSRHMQVLPSLQSPGDGTGHTIGDNRHCCFNVYGRFVDHDLPLRTQSDDDSALLIDTSASSINVAEDQRDTSNSPRESTQGKVDSPLNPLLLLLRDSHISMNDVDQHVESPISREALWDKWQCNRHCCSINVAW